MAGRIVKRAAYRCAARVLDLHHISGFSTTLDCIDFIRVNPGIEIAKLSVFISLQDRLCNSWNRGLTLQNGARCDRSAHLRRAPPPPLANIRHTSFVW